MDFGKTPSSKMIKLSFPPNGKPLCMYQLQPQAWIAGGDRHIPGEICDKDGLISFHLRFYVESLLIKTNIG